MEVTASGYGQVPQDSMWMARNGPSGGGSPSLVVGNAADRQLGLTAENGHTSSTEWSGSMTGRSPGEWPRHRTTASEPTSLLNGRVAGSGPSTSHTVALINSRNAEGGLYKTPLRCCPCAIPTSYIGLRAMVADRPAHTGRPPRHPDRLWRRRLAAHQPDPGVQRPVPPCSTSPG